MEYRENMTHEERSEYIDERFAEAFPYTTPGRLRSDMGLPPLGTRRTTKGLADAVAEALGEKEAGNGAR